MPQSTDLMELFADVAVIVLVSYYDALANRVEHIDRLREKWTRERVARGGADGADECDEADRFASRALSRQAPRTLDVIAGAKGPSLHQSNSEGYSSVEARGGTGWADGPAPTISCAW